MKTKRVGIWIRVSTEDQAKGESPEHHEHRARMYAEVKGWDVIEVYHLEGVSGKTVHEHPEAKRMLKDIKNGHIEGLIFSKLARLARNTKELLEFADFFKEYDADLISLQEAIDTSSPAGRLFYTLIAAMAQWEREEIAERVAASVPIRAKLGKPLGGQAPFGYSWENKELVINEDEAPIRRLIFELYIEHRRKKTVASMINERGYRTRKGSLFTGNSVTRLVRDPIAKGMRRANYSKSLGEGKHWVMKPEEEWVIIPAPAIVSEEIWDRANAIMDEQGYTRKPVQKRTKNLFVGIAKCGCGGGNMFVRSKSPRYVCKHCRTKITPQDLEDIYRDQLKKFVVSEELISQHLAASQATFSKREIELADLTAKANTLQSKLDRLLQLNLDGELPSKGFRAHYEPLFKQKEQLETTINELTAELDYLKIHLQSSDQILFDAQDLHARWPSLSLDEKRLIVQEITDSIIIGSDTIEINLKQLPTADFALPSEKVTFGVHNSRDSCSPPA